MWWKVVQSGGKGGRDAMFMGEYQHSIDEKGRMIIPAKFREALGDSFVITRGLGSVLIRLSAIGMGDTRAEAQSTAANEIRCACLHPVLLLRRNGV